VASLTRFKPVPRQIRGTELLISAGVPSTAEASKLSTNAPFTVIISWSQAGFDNRSPLARALLTRTTAPQDAAQPYHAFSPNRYSTLRSAPDRPAGSLVVTKSSHNFIYVTTRHWRGNAPASKVACPAHRTGAG
jgi:hypothetical protein